MASDSHQPHQTIYGLFPYNYKIDHLSTLCIAHGGVQTGPFGSQLHQEDYVNVGTPIITVEHLGENRIIHINIPMVSNSDRDRLAKYSLETGDIVFSRVGSVDRRALIREPEKGWLFSGRCLRVRPDQQQLDPGYLSYFFGLESFKSYIRSIAVGATMPSLNTTILSDIEIAYPPLPEQRRIAHILGTLDDRIENNRKTAKTLEAMAQAIFHSWFVDFDPVRAKMAGESRESICKRLKLTPEILDLFPDRLVDSELGEIPEGWGVGVLDAYIKSTLGGDWGTDSITSENNVAVQCIRGADIAALNAGGMGKMPTRYIKTASYEKRKIHPGNIVLEISGGSPTQSTGRSTLVTEEILQRSNLPLITSNFCRAIQFWGIQQSLYISYLLKHLYANDEFLQYENGSTGIKNFAFTLFCSEHPIVLPMSAILVHFEAMVRNFHKRSAVVRAESDIIEDIRDSLLPKLISGEIRVPGAERLLEESRR